MAVREDLRRRGDGLFRSAFGRVVGRPVADGNIDPVLLGRVLLLVTIGLVTIGVPALDTLDSDAWLQVSATDLAIAVALAASFAVPWGRLSTRAPLVFPTLVVLVLFELSVADAAGSFAPLSGLLSLCFAYIGLTQPPRTALAMLPVAAFGFVFVSGGFSAAVGIRLVIGCVVWSILGELLAHFMRRQSALSTALRAAAHVDVLTGVANRRDLELRLATVAPGDTIVLCDLDHFKLLNDSQGHHVGDQVLAEFGSMLRASLRGRDYCARYGGEEFVLILPATNTVDALTTLSRMHAHWDVLRPGLSFSAGVASCTAERAHTETLGAADRALYAAKDSGRNCDRVDGDISSEAAEVTTG